MYTLNAKHARAVLSESLYKLFNLAPERFLTANVIVYKRFFPLSFLSWSELIPSLWSPWSVCPDTQRAWKPQAVPRLSRSCCCAGLQWCIWWFPCTLIPISVTVHSVCFYFIQSRGTGKSVFCKNCHFTKSAYSILFVIYFLLKPECALSLSLSPVSYTHLRAHETA